MRLKDRKSTVLADVNLAAQSAYPSRARQDYIAFAKRILRRRVDVPDIGQGGKSDGRDDQELLPTLEQEHGRHDVRIAAEPPEVDQRSRKKDGDGAGYRHTANAQERGGRLGCVQ